MNRKLQKWTMFMDFAHQIQTLSTCKRHATGVIIFPSDCSQILSVGFNGPARGLPNDSCTGEMGQCGCSHAEINALLKLGTLQEQAVLYSTVSPCVNCASAIINSQKIKLVVFDKLSRHEHRPLRMLEIATIGWFYRGGLLEHLKG